MQLTQLEKDIRNRLNEKLELWVEDSFSLCDSARFDEGKAMALVLSVLLSATMQGLYSAGYNQGQIIEMVQMYKGRNR